MGSKTLKTTKTTKFCHTLVEGVFKNAQMQDAQIRGNEAYFYVRRKDA